MPTLEQIEESAMSLNESQRAILASHLLDSLSPPTSEEYDFSEADRRSEEMDNDPSASLTWKEIKTSLGR